MMRLQFIQALRRASGDLVLSGAVANVSPNVPIAKKIAQAKEIFFGDPHKEDAENPILRAIIFFAFYDIPTISFLEKEEHLEEAWEYYVHQTWMRSTTEAKKSPAYLRSGSSKAVR